MINAKIKNIIIFLSIIVVGILLSMCLLGNNILLIKSNSQLTENTLASNSVSSTNEIDSYITSQVDDYVAPINRTIVVSFAKFNFMDSYTWSNYDKLEIMKMLCETTNDNQYSVLEYFRDASLGKINFNFQFRDIVYEKSYNYLTYSDKRNVIEIAFLPVKAIDRSSPYWSACSQINHYVQICYNHKFNFGTLCHELSHIFGVFDYYSVYNNNLLASTEIFVGGWDIMGQSGLNASSSLTAYSRQKAFQIEESYFDDGKTTPIEKASTSGRYTITANGYASAEDIMAIKIPAKVLADLGYKYIDDINFWIEYRKPTGNGLDRTTINNRDSLIVYRSNRANIARQVNATSSKDTELYVFRKYNNNSPLYCALFEGDTFGDTETSRIYMPDGTAVDLVISNIKFNTDNTASFNLSISSNTMIIMGELIEEEPDTSAYITKIFVDGVENSYTFGQNKFALSMPRGNHTLTFYRGKKLIATQTVSQPMSKLIVYADASNTIQINITNISQLKNSVYVYLIEDDLQKLVAVANDDGKIELNTISGSFKIVSNGCKDYYFSTENSITLDINLEQNVQNAESNSENTWDRLTRNMGSSIDGIKSVINYFGDIINGWLF